MTKYDDYTARARVQRAAPTAPDAPAEKFPLVVASSLAGKSPPPRRWLVPGWIPDRTVTLLYGDGGTGKSLLALQLMLAATAGTPWLGLPVDQRRAFALFCEDETDEVHRRLIDITTALAVDVGRLEGFGWSSVVDDDALIAAPSSDNPNAMIATAAWNRLIRTIEAHKARLVVLDTAADIFGGDEIKRAQVRSFMAMLGRLARAIDGAVIVTAHPSVDGIRSGVGSSGSTAWSNGARSRLYLARPVDEQDGADPDARVLSCKKANFSTIGETINLRWERGAFAAIGAPAGLDRAAINAKADRVFRDLLRATYSAGIWVSAQPAARNYAPAMFARRPDREDLGRPALEGALHRLLQAGTIRLESYGRRGDERTRIAPA